MIRLSIPLTLCALFLTSVVSVADDEAAAKDLFETLDANSDGTLDSSEIGDEQRQAFNRLLRVGDANDDGKLTKVEYQQGLKPDDPVELNQPGGRPGSGQNRPQPIDVGQLFKMADRDGDGRIAIEDLPEPMQERLQPLFERIGKDELTREDFEDLRRMQGGQPFRLDVERLFENADRDGDGKIALDDLPEPMQERLQPVFERFGKDELTREDFESLRGIPGGRPGQGRPGSGGNRSQMALLRVLDEDENGQLSKAEIAKLADKFADLDRNGDGQLGVGELMGFAGGRMSRGDGRRPQQRPEGDDRRMQRPQRPDGADGRPQQEGNRSRGFDQFFSQNDKDDDGFLSRDEAPDRLSERFDRIDANSDGKLTKDEVQRAFSRRNRDSDTQ